MPVTATRTNSSTSHSSTSQSSTSIHQTACPLDCPDSCSLDVRVEDGRVSKLDGNRRNAVTGGYICAKVRRFGDHVYGEDRLLSPMRRVGDKGGNKGGNKGQARFETISWHEAIGEIADRFTQIRDEHGGEAILPFSYGGSNGLLSQDTIDARLFRRLGASRLARTVCAAATTAAISGLYGRMPGIGYEDFAESRLIVVWGANPSAAGIHLVPYILEAKKRGAALVVVDPRRTPLAAQADLHLAVKPGTDLPLALAVLHRLFTEGGADQAFLAEHTTGAHELAQRAARWTTEAAAEVCDVPAADIREFARLYAELSPAVIRCGWGQERNRNGGSATAAILALPAVGGKFGVRGGGYMASNSFPFDPEAIINEPPAATRILNMNRLGRQLLEAEPAIHGLFVYNANPLATLPRQDLVRRGLEREDLFTVVFDQVMTDTALYADLVLPATTFLEHQDLRKAYGAYALQTVRPVIDPVGEARSNQDVFEALIEALDLQKPGDVSAAELLAAVCEHGFSGEQRHELEGTGLCEPDFGRRPIQMVDIMPGTCDGKIHLLPEKLDSEATHGLYSYQPPAESQESQESQVSQVSQESRQLSLISPATNKTISSSLGQIRKDRVALEMHPDDAAHRGLQSGDAVRIWNQHGEVICSLRIERNLRPGVASLAKGLWCRQTASGTTGNVLVPDTYTDLGDGACFNDTRVDVERAAS